MTKKTAVMALNPEGFSFFSALASDLFDLLDFLDVDRSTTFVTGLNYLFINYFTYPFYYIFFSLLLFD